MCVGVWVAGSAGATKKQEQEPRQGTEASGGGEGWFRTPTP